MGNPVWALAGVGRDSTGKVPWGLSGAEGACAHISVLMGRTRIAQAIRSVISKLDIMQL